MIKRIIPIAILGAAVIAGAGCKNGSSGDFKELKGIEYKIVKDVPGRKAQVGDIVEFNMYAKIDTFVLADSRKQAGKPVPIRVEDVKGSGDWRAVFPMLSAGDSAILEISCDTIIKNLPPNQQQRPPWMKPGKKIVINLSIASIKSMEEYKKEEDERQAVQQKDMKEKAAAQMPIDDKILQDYFAKHNIKPEKTESGVYYTVQKPGSGEQIKTGETVSVKYTGKTLEGKAFDSNVDTSVGHHGTAPLTFKVGVKQMIPGFDEGVSKLKKGAKATLYLPSPLAYGPQAISPEVGPNSILIFDIEITDVKSAPDKGPGSPMPNQ